MALRTFDAVDTRSTRPPPTRREGLGWALAGGVLMFALTFGVGASVLAFGLIERTAVAEVPETEFETGQRVYAQSCASCHGPAGEGLVGPALDGGQVVAKYPDAADHRDIVINGKGAMPSFARQLTPAEIDAVVAYERTGL